MKRKLSSRVAFGGMTAALSALFVLLAAYLPTGRAGCLFVATLFPYLLSGEGDYAFSLLSYFAAVAAAFILSPDPIYPFIFALVGHYGVFRAYLRNRIVQRKLAFALGTIWCVVFIAVGALLLKPLGIGDTISLPVYMLIGAGAVLSIFFVALYGYCCDVFDRRLRGRLPR